MYDLRDLLGAEAPRHRRLHAPRASLWTRARILGQPVLVSCHWHLRLRRSVPHLTVGCPLCIECGPLERYDQAYVAAALHQRTERDGAVSDGGHWSLNNLTLPGWLAEELSRQPVVGTDWRGVEADFWHPERRENAPLACNVLGRRDAERWPPSWNVRADLDYAWREYLAMASRQIALEEPTDREPGEEG
jgi:hypothetical protein